MRLEDKVDSILDGWFGESLENSENEERLRRYLYEPLRAAIRQAYRDGKDDGERDAALPLELRGL